VGFGRGRLGVLAVAMLLVVVACGGGTDSVDGAASSSTQPTEATTPVASTATSLSASTSVGADDDVVELPPGVEPFPEPNPLNLEISLEEGNTAEATIGAEGGTLEVTSADGARFVLEVPAGALASPEQIRMTPAAAVKGVPFEAGALATVDLEPDGLGFYEPVTLRIELPDTVATEDLVSFGTYDSGQDFHLYPSSSDGNVLEVQLSHFSSAGASAASRAERERIAAAYTPSQSDAYAQDQAAVIVSNVDDPQARADAIDKIGKQWFYNSILVRLQNAAVNESGLDQALGELNAWLAFMSAHIMTQEDYETRFSAERELARNAVAEALKNATQRAGRRCQEENDPVEALRILRYVFMAKLFKVNELVKALDPTINENLHACLDRFGFVFRSRLDLTGPEGGVAISQVTAKIGFSTTGAQSDATLRLLGTAPLQFEINSVSPMPPKCTTFNNSGTMEVWAFPNMNLQSKTPEFTHVNLFFEFPSAPAEGMRCGGVGREVPRWAPAFEGMNKTWGSMAGGFNITLPIVRNGATFAELEIKQAVTGVNATEESTYQLTFGADN